MPSRGQVCGAAALGGVSTNLFTLGVALINGRALPNASYLLGLAIFAAMGAAVAFLFQEKSCRKAFFLGLALPSLIQVGADNASRADGDRPKTMVGLSLLPVSHAEEPSGPTSGRKLKLLAGGELRAYAVVFASADGRREEKVRVEGALKTLDVPDYASRFAVEADDARSENRPLPAAAGRTIFVRVLRRGNVWSGLQRSIGLHDAPEFEIVIEPQKH